MNVMTKQRYISTSIWDDDWFDSLSEREKLAYFYLLTNPHTNAAGVYQCTLKNMRLEMGLEREEVEQIMKKFSDAGKAYYIKDYIIIPKWLKHQKAAERNGILLGAKKVLKSLPDEIKEFLADRKHYDWDISDIVPPTKKGSATPLPPHENRDISIEFPELTGVEPPINGAKTLHDSDSDLDRDIDLDGDCKPTPTQCEKLVENQKTTTTIDLHNIIKEKVKNHGFYIDDPVVKKIAKSIQDPTWFTSEFSIIDLVAEKINEIYSGKPKEERKKLFVSALTKWENIQDEYPDWLKKKIKTAEASAMERLRNTPPKLCLKCQTDLKGERLCPNCQGFMIFSEEERTWKYDPHVEFGSFRDEMRRKKQEKLNNETAPPQVEEIDFFFGCKTAI